MSEKQFRLPSEDHDHNIPLKAVKVRPPSPDSTYSQSKYTVNIELSRQGSRFEQDAVKKFFPQGRIYGKTLELSQTTVESIAEGAATVSSQLAALEREARIAQDRADELQRQRDAEAAAEAARYEGLKDLANQVRFE